MTDAPHRPPREPLVPAGGCDLHGRDMTATFAADVTLRDAQARLAALDQWLPIDGDRDATLGTLVDRNSTGPLRLGYGAWRDLLLGAQFRNGRDELITAGGRTVKNVAGYDLTKFMVGQHGTFGRLVTLTARTYRRPAGAVLATFDPDPTLLPRLMPTPLRPQWALLTRAELFCGYIGDEPTLAWYAANLPQMSPRKILARAFDDDLRHRAALWRFGGLGTFRVSVPPARVMEFTDELAVTNWIADPAFGVVAGSLDGADEAALRARAASLSGSVTLLGADGRFDASTNPVERQIIERLKDAFDPDRHLNPLPWQTP